MKLCISHIPRKSALNVTYPLWHVHLKDIIYQNIGWYAVILISSLLWKQGAQFYISVWHGVNIAFHIAKVIWQTQSDGDWKVKINPVCCSKVMFSICVIL